MCRATGVEPTNDTADTPGWSRRASTAVASPWTTVKIPSGSPASAHTSATSSEADGSRSDGFRMKALPQAMATGYIHIGTITGKLNGVIPAMTPSGWRIDEASTPVARQLYERAAVAGKRAQALGGAKNHAVVMPDADLVSTADALIGAGYGSAGERCMAISVVVAVGDGDRLVDELAQRAAALTTGPGTDPNSDMGPLITGAHRDRVAGYLGSAESQGAAVVLDGRSVQVPGGDGGFYLGPSLVDHVEPAMDVYRDEIFGPVLSVVRVDDLDAAIALVNANPYGNGTAIFTRDGHAARQFRRQVTVGMVGINVAIPVPMAYFSFGGWKQSLFGDAHVHGMEGVRFATRLKSVTTRWPEPADPEDEDDPKAAAAQLHFPSGDAG